MRILVMLLVCCLLDAATPAEAHRIYISAWVEGNRMCSESMFANKSKARDSRVTVLDTAGQMVHEGRTDDMGVACFPLREKPAALTFVVNAGQGHRAETSLLPEDFADALLASDAERASADSTAAVMEPATTGAADGDAPGDALPALGQDALVSVVRETVRSELQKQLGPVRQSLASLQSHEPGMLEIFGGIGWIAGLAGVAMMVANRRRDD